MKRSFGFFTRTLHGRLLLLVSLPLILLAVLLTVNTISNERLKVHQQYYGLGFSAASYLAATSDFALYSGNEQLLNTLAASMTEIGPIDGVAFLNAEREVLTSTLGVSPWANLLPTSFGLDPLIIGSRIYFERPVSISAIEIDDYKEDELVDTESAATIGWVIIAVDMSAMDAERQAIMISNGSAAASLLALVFALSYALGRGLITPITSLTATVEDIERGNLAVKAQVTGVEELAALGRGINYMAESIAGSQRSLEQRVDSATARLRVLLDDVQRKNIELEQARQKAEDASQAKSDFLARMSHELRTPLNAIQGFVRLLGKSNLDASEQQYCAIIEQAAEQLLLLIEDILEHARLQSGAMALEILPLDIVACVENPVRLLGPSAYEKNVEVIIDVDPGLPIFVYGDSLRLRQVVSNLVANAIKFTDRGHVMVRLSHQAISDDQIMLVLEVEDTGIGMSEVEQEKVFDAFTQADTTITRRFGGTGLGLSIVHALVRLMGGEIALHSVESAGTRIRVCLPMGLQQGREPLIRLNIRIAVLDTLAISRQALGHALQRMTDALSLYADLEVLIKDLRTGDIQAIVISLPISEFEHSLADMLVRLRTHTQVPILVFLPLRALRDKAAFNVEGVEGLEAITYLTKPWASSDFLTGYKMLKDGPPGDTASTAPLLGVRVLVAEDNEFSRLLLSTLFDKAGCETVAVINGRQALEACAERVFDILVFDVHMPELNGIEALAAIRKAEDGGLNKATPAVVLTADILQHKNSLATLEGVNILMHKPFDDKRLIGQMMTLLGSKKNIASRQGMITRRIPLTRFFQEVDKLLLSAVSAYQDRNIEELREIIHQLLGVAGVFKLGELEKQVQALHTLVKAQDPWVGDALRSVGEEVDRLKVEAGDELV